MTQIDSFLDHLQTQESEYRDARLHNDSSLQKALEYLILDQTAKRRYPGFTSKVLEPLHTYFQQRLFFHKTVTYCIRKISNSSHSGQNLRVLH